MSNKAFKRMLAFSFTVGLKNFLLLLKSFTTKVLEYKTILKFKKLFVCITTHLLVTSPCLHEFLLTSLYIYTNIIIMVVDYCSSLTYECLVLNRKVSTCLKLNFLLSFSPFRHSYLKCNSFKFFALFHDFIWSRIYQRFLVYT